MVSEKETKTDEWFEKQYSPSFWSKKHPDREAAINHFYHVLTQKSEEIRETLAVDLNVSYGDSKNTRIDYFYGDISKDKCNDKPVYVYIHGGYWQEGNKEFYSAVACSFVKNKFNSAVIGYDLAPNCSISESVLQVAEAIDAIYAHFNQSKLIIFGHSAGAFLTAAVARIKPSMIQEAVLISGVYDLCPLLKTSYNEALKLTMEQAEELTEMVFDYHVNVSTHIFVGEDESPEFKKQSQMFYDRLVDNKITCSFKIVPNEDHFSIIENLVDEQSVLCRDLLVLGNHV